MTHILLFEGTHPTIDASAFVAPGVSVIGDVEIGPDVSIWYGCVVRGDVNEIRIGARSNIQDGSVVHCTYRKFGTHIGADVLIGHMALIHGCTIGDGAFIGMKACLMDGVVVEEGAMVAAGALVTPGKVVKAGQLWAGSPARYMRDLTEADRQMMKDVIPHYIRLANRHKDAIGDG